MLTAKRVPEADQDEFLSSLEAIDRPVASGNLAAPGDRAMLRYVDRLTTRPWEIGEDDIAGLRDHGFDDRVIHDICAVASYYAFVNRIADGLGVELEDRW